MTYDLAYQRATECTGGAEPGTVALLAYLDERWPHIWSKGIYNCRDIRGSSSKSVHSEGRAVDVGVDETGEGYRVGNEIAMWLVKHAESIGCQYFIWDRQSWRQSRGWRIYRGTSDHRDHLHVEMTREAAAAVTIEDLRALDQPHGTDTREGHQVGPWHIGQVISYAQSGDGVYLLTIDGGVYCFPPSLYRGGPNDEIDGREFDFIGEPDSIFIDDSGYSYIVSTDLDFAYGYG